MVKNYKENAICDFCGEKSSSEFMTMTNPVGRKLNICKKCSIKEGLIIETDQDINRSINVLTPMEIVEKLDKRIVSQEIPKKQVALEVFMHLLRITNKNKLIAMGKKIRKNNIMIIGNTGCGKTLLAQTIAEIVNVPFSTTTCSTLSETGFAGADVESVISGIYNASGQNLKRCEKGIVFLDEVDKLCQSDESNHNIKGVNSTGVQKSLLTIIENTRCRIQPQNTRQHPQMQTIEVSTEDILFIAAGAFQGIEYSVKDRLSKKLGKDSIGFGATRSERKEYTSEQLRTMVTTADLQYFGMIPEFLARFPILINMGNLNESDLFSILKLQNGLIDEYKTYFNLLGKELIIDDSAIMKIAKIAHKSLLGARSLRSVIKEILNDLLFDAPTNPNTATYHVTNRMVEKIFCIKYDNVI